MTSQYTTILFIMNVVCLGAIKLSVLLLYRRLFAVSRRFNITSIIMGVIIFLWTLGYLLSYIFECGTHLRALWTSVPAIEEYCDNETVQTVSFCVTDVVTDLMILVTPIPMIMKLQMSIPQKLGICAVFALGLLSVFSAIHMCMDTNISQIYRCWCGQSSHHRTLRIR